MLTLSLPLCAIDKMKNKRSDLDKQLYDLDNSGQGETPIQPSAVFQPNFGSTSNDGFGSAATSSAGRSSNANGNRSAAFGSGGGGNRNKNNNNMHNDSNDDEGWTRPNKLSLEALADQMNRMQQMQDWLLMQKEQEMSLLKQKVEEQQKIIMEKEVEMALLKEKLAQQETRMQHELKLIKMAAYNSRKDRERETRHRDRKKNKDSDGTEEEVKKIHIEALHVNVAGPAGEGGSGVDPQSIQGAIGNSLTDALGSSNNSSKNDSAPISEIAAVREKEVPKKMKRYVAPTTSSANDKVEASDSDDDDFSGLHIGDLQDMTITDDDNKKDEPPVAATANGLPPNVKKAPPPPPPAEKSIEDEEEKEPEGLPKGNYDNDHDDVDEDEMEDQFPTDIGYDNHNDNMNEEVTLGSALQDGGSSSDDKFSNTKKLFVGGGMKDSGSSSGGGDNTDAFTVGNTVATSTYGEDRQKVVNQTVLDPYGDSGQYTGVVLLSTGMPHGLGRMVYEDDGRTYEGDWRHGRWHGFGRATFANGDSYEGEYRFDQRHGRGLYQWADGRQYDGDFYEDKRHGRGTFKWPDGAIYEGDFVHGQREGRGRYTFSDGGFYVGGWVDGRYEGYGECTWEDGRVYKGEWQQGMAHGRGVETYANGEIRHEGLWEHDDPVRED